MVLETLSNTVRPRPLGKAGSKVEVKRLHKHPGALMKTIDWKKSEREGFDCKTLVEALGWSNEQIVMQCEMAGQ